MKTIEKERQKLQKAVSEEKTQRFLEAGAYLFAGFLLARSIVPGIGAPFAVALICVSGKNNYYFSALGAAVGFLMFCPADFPRYAAAVLIALLSAVAMRLAEVKNDPALPMLTCFLTLLATGFVVDLKSSAALVEYTLTLAESILGAGAAFFFFRTINCSRRRLRFRALPVSDAVCIVISAALLMMSLSALKIGGISPARIIALAAILICLRFGSDKLGIMLALSLGFGFGLAEDGALYLVGAYGFSALLAALFSPFGAASLAISFVLSSALFTITAGAPVCFFIEPTAAAIILLLIPPRLCDRLYAFFHDGADITPDGSLRRSLVMRLRFAASAVNYISESVNDVREKINDINEKNRPQEYESLSESERIAREIINEKTNEIRTVAADQFFSISDMLSDLAAEFDEAESFDAIAAGKLRRLLGEYEIYPKNISAIEDKYGRMRIEILADGKETGFANPKLQREISKTCGRYFAKCSITHFQKETMITFTEKPNYYVDAGFAQHSAEGGLCGDTVKIINDSRGHHILIISDGMGKGGRAALDGAMGAGLLAKLLSAGFGFDSALKVVNCALLVKSNDESLATLDCAAIDTFTGRVDLYKAGAPASYIIKSGRVNKCELSSMPAGILRGIEFAKRTAVLSSGDYIVLVSDGITDLGTDWLRALLTGAEDAPVQELADEILREAVKMSEGKKADDMSVIAARLCRID